MRRTRRSSPEPRLEMTPLMDVVFLLLTYFILVQVVMKQVSFRSVTLPRFAGADEQGTPRATVTVAIDASGAVSIDEDPVELDALVATLKASLARTPNASPVLAVDEACPSGELLRVMDRLREAGLVDLGLLGRPGGPAPSAPGSAPPG